MADLSRIRCFILDMDGTFYLGNRLLPGALDFIGYLRETGREFLFLTNNSSRHAEYYTGKLARLGLRCGPEDVLTAGEATAHYIKLHKAGARIFLLGTPELEHEFAQHGFQLTADQPDFVVLGFDTTLTYEKLATACHLIRKGVPFIATHPDINCPTEEGYIPDCGAMTALIQASTGISPKVIGKPNREIIDMILLKKGRFTCEQMAIVGDRLYTDIATGCNAGIGTVLVFSGETNRGDLAASAVQPDLACEDLARLLELLQESDRLAAGS
jgi:HAD superfamily hydrolase (TIGR01457 family)